jgi:RimJ/RimL family protein N-acetyltransferase
VIEAEAQIRRLTAADAARYREIRLEALKLAPEAFSSTFAAENAEPMAWFAARLDNSVVFAAVCGVRLLGIAAFLSKRGKEAHKGLLVGMYVREANRNRGTGRRLAETVVGHAVGKVEILQLAVVADNQPARRLYARLGFVEYGIERRALKQDEHYWDEVLMAKPLTPPQGTR